MKPRRSCTQFMTGTSGKTTKTFSYVVLLCEKGGSEVKAVRLDGYTSKYDLNFQDDLKGNYPDWNIKGIWKLYDEDFD